MPENVRIIIFTAVLIVLIVGAIILFVSCNNEEKKKFETGFKDGDFASAESLETWSRTWEPDGTYHEWSSESYSPETAGSLFMCHPENTASSSHVSQEINLVKNAKYKFSGYIKLDNIRSVTANGNGGAYCTLGDQAIGVYTKMDVPTSIDWTYYETFYTATYTGTFVFSCRIWGAYGNAYFDDLKLELVEKADPEVVKHWANKKDIKIPSDGFSLIAIGDPQAVVAAEAQGSSTEYVDSMKDLVEISKTWNTQYIMDMGDLVDSCGEPAQWRTSVKGHDVLDDAEIKYSLVCGNHDYNGLVGLKNGVYIDRNTSAFETRYKYENYVRMYGTENFGSYNETMLDTYHKFTYDGVKYMIIALEYAPTREIVKWAKDLCDSNPDHKIIFTTHCLIWPGGEVGFRNEQTDHLKDAVNPTYMWDNLITVCPNIFLVCCGHCNCHGICGYITYGNSGNKITTICVNPQGTIGGCEMMTAILHIENGTDVTCYAYSPSVKEYYAGSNFKIELTSEFNVKDGVLDLPENFSGKLFDHTILDKATVTYAYSSDNESVVTVSEDGTVICKGKGKATITCLINTAQSAYAIDGPGARIKVIIQVNVG